MKAQLDEVPGPHALSRTFQLTFKEKWCFQGILLEVFIFLSTSTYHSQTSFQLNWGRMVDTNWNHITMITHRLHNNKMKTHPIQRQTKAWAMQPTPIPNYIFVLPYQTYYPLKTVKKDTRILSIKLHDANLKEFKMINQNFIMASMRI